MDNGLPAIAARVVERRADVPERLAGIDDDPGLDSMAIQATADCRICRTVEMLKGVFAAGRPAEKNLVGACRAGGKRKCDVRFRRPKCQPCDESVPLGCGPV